MRLFLPAQLHGLSLALKVWLKISYMVRVSARFSTALVYRWQQLREGAHVLGGHLHIPTGELSAFSFARRSSHPQSSTTAWTSLSIPVAFVSFAILSPSPLDFFSDTSYRGVEFMAADARRLGK